MGLGAEMWAVWGALPAIRSRGLRSVALPNPLNFGFDYHTFLVVRVPLRLPSGAMAALAAMPCCLPARPLHHSCSPHHTLPPAPTPSPPRR